MGGVPWLLPMKSQHMAGVPYGRWLRDRVTPPPANIVRAISVQGLETLPMLAAAGPLLDQAQDLIAGTSGLAPIVATWVQDIHLLTSTPGYDVSHSEPRWPTRIFISVPERTDGVGALRLTENVIHEAMHLLLTGVEARKPLVADPEQHIASPWRAERRPVGGVLHGLFVFTCLSAFFAEVVARLDGDMRKHALGRINNIKLEIGSIDMQKLFAGLTPYGVALTRRFRSGVVNR
jgi:HEXXH motif-containing protein